MIELALFLKRNGYRPDQVQDFIPAPMDVATSMYYTGLDPRTLEPVTVARKMHDRHLQRALLQFFKPENYFAVCQALRAAGRADLIGDGCDALVPARPPRQALAAAASAPTRGTRGDVRAPDHSGSSGPALGPLAAAIARIARAPTGGSGNDRCSEPR